MPITKFACDPPPNIITQLTYLQGTTSVRNKIDILLLHLAGLEALFATRPGNVTEQGRRSELIRYLCCYSSTRPGTEFLSVSSGVSRDNYDHHMGRQGYIGLMNPFKAMEMCSGFSKTYKRPSLTIRFAHNRAPFSMLTRIIIDHATKGDQ